MTLPCFVYIIHLLPMKEIKKELVLLNDIREISRLASFIEEIGDELSLPATVAFNLNLALEEAVSNIILYAYPGQTGKEIKVYAATTANCLVFTLTDTGESFDPLGAKGADITLPLEERPVGGLGIFLIKNIMDEVEYQRIEGKNIFTLKKELLPTTEKNNMNQ